MYLLPQTWNEDKNAKYLIEQGVHIRNRLQIIRVISAIMRIQA